jgi:hypothetical protein
LSSLPQVRNVAALLVRSGCHPDQTLCHFVA